MNIFTNKYILEYLPTTLGRKLNGP